MFTKFSFISKTTSPIPPPPTVPYHTHESNYGILLVHFFELYGRHFDYNRLCIRVRGDGKYILKEEMTQQMRADPNLNSSDPDLYDTIKPGILSIEDPLLSSNDVGKGSYNVGRVRQAYDYAYRVLLKAIHGQEKNSHHRSSLSRILRITNEVINYRRWVQETFGPQYKEYLERQGKAPELSNPTPTRDTTQAIEQAARQAAFQLLQNHLPRVQNLNYPENIINLSPYMTNGQVNPLTSEQLQRGLQILNSMNHGSISQQILMTQVAKGNLSQPSRDFEKNSFEQDEHRSIDIF